ncbi:MAG: chalcone isomerase family protein [Chromatiales bacterium]|nr:chalcone isomerase family protein [Chromatiales bacterium]
MMPNNLAMKYLGGILNFFMKEWLLMNTLSRIESRYLNDQGEKMKLITTIFLTLFMTLQVSNAVAREVAGIEVAESIRVADTELMLNGSGIRTKFFFNIYVGSLYSKKSGSSLEEIINQGAPYRVSMAVLYDEISAEKLNGGWAEGFERNLSADELKNIQTSIDDFYKLFKTVHKGDVIDIDVSGKSVTTVFLNGNKQGDIDNSAFPDALLKIWLGKEPADEDLKTGMLGG